MRLLCTGLALFCLLSGTVIKATQPNIVLVMADDLGWSDIGCFGGEIRTPHIDSLARDGLRFTQFYNNAVCGPTRASLLTGLYCQQTGHRGDHWNQPKDYARCVLISELLQNAGYHTMMVGKWQGRDPALDRGFDRFFGPMCQAKISYFHEVQQNPFYLDRERFQLPDDFYLTESFNEYAVQFLKEAVTTDKPFFLYVAHIAPHWPLHAREADIAAYREQYRERGWDEWRTTRFESQKKSELIPSHWKLAPRPPEVKDWKNDLNHNWQAERMAVYAAQVAAIDEGLGELLKVLKEKWAREKHSGPVSLRQRSSTGWWARPVEKRFWIRAQPAQRPLASGPGSDSTGQRTGESTRSSRHLCCLWISLGDPQQHAVSQYETLGL